MIRHPRILRKGFLKDADAATFITSILYFQVEKLISFFVYRWLKITECVSTKKAANKSLVENYDSTGLDAGLQKKSAKRFNYHADLAMIMSFIIICLRDIKRC
jgi:hypothetical protein